MLPEQLPVPPLAGPQRLDIYLAQTLAQYGISRTTVKKFIAHGWVRVNEEIGRRPDFKLQGQETITLAIPQGQPQSPVPALTKLYEDENCVAVNKPTGLMTHPRSSLPFKVGPHLAQQLGSMDEPTVLSWILRNYPNNQNVPRLGIVHRLDTDASGVLLVAKTIPFYYQACKLFARRKIEKTYLALVWGCPQEPEGTIELGIIKKYSKNKIFMRVSATGGKEAKTIYAVKRTFKQTSLLELTPQTGRTHQLRLHLAGIGHPICGDAIYKQGAHQNPQEAPFKRLMLHAWKLAFTRPASATTIEITAPRPKEFLKKY